MGKRYGLIVIHQPGFKGKLKIKLPQDEDNDQKIDTIMWGVGREQTTSHISSSTQGRSLRVYFRGCRELLQIFFPIISAEM